MMRERAANFDPLARVYAPLEQLSFGRALARRRTCFLDDLRIASVRRVLVLGDGDGRFTAALVARYPAVEVSAVDASAAMLGELRRRVTRTAPRAQISVHHADLRIWTPPLNGFDLVVAHFFFDCFTSKDVAAMVARIAPALSANASWLVSDFAIPAGGVRALVARLLVRILYWAFWAITGLEVKCLPDFRALSHPPASPAPAQRPVWAVRYARSSGSAPPDHCQRKSVSRWPRRVPLNQR